MKKILLSLFAVAMGLLVLRADEAAPKPVGRRPLAVIKPAVDASFADAHHAALL